MWLNLFSCYIIIVFSYQILAPTIMYQEKEPKVAAQKCFESIGLDPDMYRCGHTKASNFVSSCFYPYYIGVSKKISNPLEWSCTF